jgi:hypothetical protein
MATELTPTRRSAMRFSITVLGADLAVPALADAAVPAPTPVATLNAPEIGAWSG